MLSGNGELDSRKVADVSSQAEGKGFDGLWVGETTLRDASVLASVAACATKKIQLGTSIVNVFTRAPGQLAMMGATINELSGGRFTLGLGISTDAIVKNWHGQLFDMPVQRLDETVKLIRQYFSGERFSHEGTFCSPTNRRLRMKPTPKIALAALNDHMIKKAATLADRVILNLYPTERIGHAIKLIEEAQRTTHGKSRPTLSVMLYAYPLGDDEKGLDAARDLVAFLRERSSIFCSFLKFGLHSGSQSHDGGVESQGQRFGQANCNTPDDRRDHGSRNHSRPKRTSKALP